MPLIQSKSKKSFEKNVETEMDAGKPKAQSLAIAYAMKRRADNKAYGGMVHEPEIHKDMIRHIIEQRKMAMGGMVKSDDNFLKENYDDASQLSDGQESFEGTDMEDPIDPMEKKRQIMMRVMGR